MNANEKSYDLALDRAIFNFTNVLRTLAYQNTDEAERQYKVSIRALEFAVLGARSTQINVNLVPEKLERISELTVDIEGAISKQRSSGWNVLLGSIKTLLATLLTAAGLPVPQVLRLQSSSAALRLGR